MKTRMLLAALLGAHWLIPQLAAQTNSFSVSWFTLDSGGNTKTGQVYAVNASLDGLHANTISGGSYAVSGFWDGFSEETRCTPLTILSQPSSVNTCVGDCVTFSVAAVGSGPVHAQWFVDGRPIPGATSLSVSICPVSESHVGTYSVSLSNSCSTVASERTLLTLFEDRTPPEITCPSSLVVRTCNSSGTAVNFPPPTVRDDYDPNPVWVCVPRSGSVFPPGATRVSCEARDRCGNISQCAFNVAVLHDETAPTISCPSNMVVVARSASGANVDITVTAEDDSGAPVEIVCTPASGSLFPLGSTSVTCVATDSCRNQSRCEFTVEVIEPKLSIVNTGRELVLSWQGCATLEEVDTFQGRWRPVVGATSPHTIVPSAQQKFYRLRACE